MVRGYVYFAVVICGACVLAVEILGTRVIAPFYGASLYLWSALISVTLAALSVGYAIGGRWADNGPRLGRFALVIGLAGIWIAVIPWLRLPLLAISEGAGLRGAVLITATVLFFPPLTLLGMVSPYAIRLMASSLNVVGRTAGNLYSISTVASVVAAVLTGFFLIPAIGVSQLMYMIGFTLIATSVIGIIIQQRLTAAVLAGILLLAAGPFVYRTAPGVEADPALGLTAVRHSAYGEIRVVDRDGTRYLLIDGGMHTIVNPETWDSQFAYVNVLDLPKGMFDKPGDMLLVGLGGGSVVKSFHRAKWAIDAVEIDPVVAEVAVSHFGLWPSEATIYEMDARQYLITHDKRYDLIVMDAFGSSSIPFHLVTVEAFALLRDHLTTGGVIALNIEAVGWEDIIVRSLAVTLGRQFKHVSVLPIAEPPDQIGNLILLASDRALELPEEPPVPHDRFSAEYHRAHAWDNRFEVDAEGVPILTDELNPIDVWAERVNRVARRDLHRFFAQRGLSW
ncbi:MAG: fused MFS/spermidine synthase [Candidatus Zixiibacteriota bacterium]